MRLLCRSFMSCYFKFPARDRRLVGWLEYSFSAKGAAVIAVAARFHDGMAVGGRQLNVQGDSMNP